MPQTIGFALAWVVSNAGNLFGLTVATQASLAAAASSLGGIILTGGLIAASFLFRPEQPKPSSAQQVYRQAAAPRVRYYGRNKTSGLMAFGEVYAPDNTFCAVLAMNQGESDAVEEHWIDQNFIEIDEDGDVLPDFGYTYEGQPRVHIELRMGTDDQLYYETLSLLFPEMWTEDHKGNGICHALVLFDGVPALKVSEFWPQGVYTVYRQVRRDCKVFDPTSESGHDIDDPSTWSWSEISGPIILDMIMHRDCLGLEKHWIENAMDEWIDAINICKEEIPLKDGGTEPRYRASGGYKFDERPADVIQRFLDTCDGVLLPTPNSGLALSVGKWDAPTVTLDKNSIVALWDLGRGLDILTTANTIKAQFTSRFHDYQETDADPWVDDEDVAARGEITEDRQFLMCPSHSQCRRLMKIAAHKANPNWSLTLQTNLSGLRVLGKRFIHVTLPDFDIDEDFEIVSDPQYVLNEDMILLGLKFNVISASEERYNWDAETEEGEAPIVPPDVDLDPAIDAPEAGDLTVGIEQRTIGGVLVPAAILEWTPPEDDSFTVQARGQVAGTSDWYTVPVNPGSLTAVDGPLEDGTTYEYQIRYVTVTGRVSDWGPEPPVSVETDSEGLLIEDEVALLIGPGVALGI